MHVFGAGSEARLQGLHPDLVKVLRRALQLSAQDFTIIEGVRSDEQCYINFGKGRTVSECLAGGCPAQYAQPGAAKVTWLGHALSSNHRKHSDGYGHAADIYPYPVSLVLNQPASKFEPLFDQLATAMFAAAGEMNVPIRWGADWNMNKIPRERGETDNPHFELRS